MALLLLAYRLTFLNRLSAVEACIDEALSVQDEIGRSPVYVLLRSHKGLLVFWRGEIDAAKRDAESALKFAKGQNYLWGRMKSQALLSLVLSTEGDYKTALNLCLEAASTSLFNVIAPPIYFALAQAYGGIGDAATTKEFIIKTLHTTHTYVHSEIYDILCLPVMAILVMRADQPVRAAEMLGLASNFLNSLTGWMYKSQMVGATTEQSRSSPRPRSLFGCLGTRTISGFR